MAKVLIGFTVGLLTAAIIFYFRHLPERFSAGKRQGERDATQALFERIAKEFPRDFDRNKDGYKTLITFKTEAVVLVERNGVKTLRIYQ
jgi:hypothetical protein